MEIEIDVPNRPCKPKLIRCIDASRPLVLLLLFSVIFCRTSIALQSSPRLTLSQVEGLISHGVPDSTLGIEIQRRDVTFVASPTVLDQLRSIGAWLLTLRALQMQSEDQGIHRENNDIFLIAGSIVDKSTGNRTAQDDIALLDVKVDKAVVAQTVSDSAGRFKFFRPGSGGFLVRVSHQGVDYVAPVPNAGSIGEIPVYDVAARVQHLSIKADVLEVEGNDRQLHVNERFFVHNLSSPPITRSSQSCFEINLPHSATLLGASAQRPGGLPELTKPEPTGAMGRYSFHFPILPDVGEKDTMFQVAYDLPYTSGTYTFGTILTMSADNFAVLLPKRMRFVSGASSNLSSAIEDPGIQTHILKNVPADQVIYFSVSGIGAMPQE